MTDFIDNDPEIKNAHDEYEKFLSDEHLQHLYLAREMYQHDKATRIANNTIKIAQAMRENGIDIDIISKCTGLSLDDINKSTS